MKDVFKKVFKSSVAEPFLFGVMTVIILEYIVFPYFNIPNNFRNLFVTSLLCGVLFFSIRYLYLKIFISEEKYYLKNEQDYIFEEETGTELDFIPNDHILIEPKKKGNKTKKKI